MNIGQYQRNQGVVPSTFFKEGIEIKSNLISWNSCLYCNLMVNLGFFCDLTMRFMLIWFTLIFFFHPKSLAKIILIQWTACFTPFQNFTPLFTPFIPFYHLSSLSPHSPHSTTFHNNSHPFHPFHHFYPIHYFHPFSPPSTTFHSFHPIHHFHHF